MENKYFIYYVNGYVETVDKLNMTLLHMVNIGMIKIIFNCADNTAYVKSEDGTHKEVKITEVRGL